MFFHFEIYSVYNLCKLHHTTSLYSTSLHSVMTLMAWLISHALSSEQPALVRQLILHAMCTIALSGLLKDDWSQYCIPVLNWFRKQNTSTNNAAMKRHCWSPDYSTMLFDANHSVRSDCICFLGQVLLRATVPLVRHVHNHYTTWCFRSSNTYCTVTTSIVSVREGGGVGGGEVGWLVACLDGAVNTMSSYTLVTM